MSKIERRYRERDGLQVIERADKMPTLTGYAAVFYRDGDEGTEYELWDGVVERISPTAFNEALKSADVRGLFNHEDELVLGRTQSGTMRLSVDTRGLKYEIDLPDTVTGREVAELVRRGDISGSSFGFIPGTTQYKRNADGTEVIERISVELLDVGPVTFPAYTGTDASVRKITSNIEDELRELRSANKPVDRTAYYAAQARAVEIQLALDSITTTNS
jgi:uncharacterized protein